MRSGEMTVPSDREYDHAVHLNWEDIAVDNTQNPQAIRVTLKQSKTDPFRKGLTCSWAEQVWIYAQ